MANFIALVYATLKNEGVNTSGMSTDEAVEKFKQLQKKSGGSGTPAENDKLKEMGVSEEKTIKDEAIENNDIKTISEEEKERLKNGVINGTISIDEVKQLPLVKKAEEGVAIPPNKSTDLIKTPERDELRKEVKDKLLKMGSFSGKVDKKDTFNGEVKQERIAHIVIGAPAGGKSSVFANPLSQKLGARIIDSDEAKKLLPEYKDGLGAGLVHEESSQIAQNMVLPEAINNGDNLVIPIVGKTPKSIEKYRDLLKKNGYKVYLDLNEVGSETSKKRAFVRFLNTGRFLSFNYLDEIGDKPLNNYKNYREIGGFDGYAHFNNEVKEGEKPRKIEQTYEFEF